MSANTYDDKHIQTLSAIEHIRKRTGMYIGRTSDGSQYEDGIYILLKEVLDNAVDEFIMGYGKRIEIVSGLAESETVLIVHAPVNVPGQTNPFMPKYPARRPR